MMKKRLAFTLGEILIALGVIGVVASLVLPLLVNGQKAGEARARFDTAYSLLSKTVAELDAENISVEPASYSAAGSFYPIIKEHLKVAIDCGKYSATNDSVCFSTSNTNAKSTFRRMSGTEMTQLEKSMWDDGGVVLNNGMLVAIENPASYPYGLLIMVDTNGKNKNPNKLGYDLFAFELTKGGVLLPLGAPGTGKRSSALAKWGAGKPDAYCDKKKNHEFNGMTCAYFAATDADYFKKLYNGH